MLKGIHKLLTGDLLKTLSDMGHGDEMVLADANFPSHAVARRLILLPGTDGVDVLKAVLSVFPLDTYSSPAFVMDLTESDKEKGMPEPEIWPDYERLCGQPLGKLERFEFYERARKAYAVIQTGEERQYGNLILVKGMVLAQEKLPGHTRGAEYYRNLGKRET